MDQSVIMLRPEFMGSKPLFFIKFMIARIAQRKEIKF